MARKRILLLAALLFTVPLTVVIVQGLTTRQGKEARALDYVSETGFTEAQWVEAARAGARIKGLVGDPEREEWALMTYGSYGTLTGDNLTPSVPRDTPVFVYQFFGEIPEVRMLGMGLDGPITNAIGMIIIFNGRDFMDIGTRIYIAASDQDTKNGLDLNFIPVDSGGPPTIHPPLIPTEFVIPTPVPEITQEALIPLPTNAP
jgi:hypothetical protein